MLIYKVEGDFDNFDVCYIDNEDFAETYNCKTYDSLLDFDGSIKKDDWLKRKILRYNDHPLGDYISNLSSEGLMVEKRAIDKLKNVMGNVEILPLECDFGDYWVINILDVLECIDYQKSEFELLSDELEDGRPRIMCFDKYEFIKEKIAGFNLFKIIDAPKSIIFANEIFVKYVQENNISGFKFICVWEG